VTKRAKLSQLPSSRQRALSHVSSPRLWLSSVTGALTPVRTWLARRASYVLKPLLDGADGVLIGGCHPGDCHYQSGNYKARRRTIALKEILRGAGIDETRVWLRWISASEGQRFADTVTEMTEFLREKGPNPMRTEWAV